MFLLYISLYIRFCIAGWVDRRNRRVLLGVGIFSIEGYIVC